jgi:hypothetical protein
MGIIASRGLMRENEFLDAQVGIRGDILRGQR